MINRLPLEFRLPNGAHAATASRPPSAEARSARARVMRQTVDCIGSHPIATLAVAFAGGLAFGFWVKGR